MTTRKIVWLSSLEEKNKEAIALLEKRLTNFYSSDNNYYSDIDFTASSWTNNDEAGFQDIIEYAKKADSILEAGCGAANILKHGKEIESKYNGSDFSEKLMKENSLKYPRAIFSVIQQPNLLPYDSTVFDLVFSVYVLEHTTNPALFLTECLRVLRPGGILIILCPDYMGYGRMSSQRAGLSSGTSMDKIKRRQFTDALITLYDNKIRIPLHCKKLTDEVKLLPKFYINTEPTVFSDKFIPDVDAVYVTSKPEILNYLAKKTKEIENNQSLKKFEASRRLIYIKLARL